jgi:hypothetical protein
MKKFTLITLFLVFAFPAVAEASSDATPGRLVTTVTHHTSTGERGMTHHDARISQARYGLFGGRLWDMWESIGWDTQNGWVYNTTLARDGNGSVTWHNDGRSGSNHWGGSGLGKAYEGWKTEWHFESNIHDPILGVITENNYPHVSMTAWGNGTTSSSKGCGC